MERKSSLPAKSISPVTQASTLLGDAAIDQLEITSPGCLTDSGFCISRQYNHISSLITQLCPHTPTKLLHAQGAAEPGWLHDCLLLENPWQHELPSLLIEILHSGNSSAQKEKAASWVLMDETGILSQ